MTNKAKEGAGNGEAQARQLLTFNVGEQLFGVEIHVIKEIIQFGTVTRVPMVPNYIRGVLNLRGAVVPVVDLLARFGNAAAVPGKRACIVIIEVAQEGARQDVGILVDSVSEVLDVDAGNIEPPPLTHVPRTKRGVISYAARDIGERLAARALVAFTQSGDTVRRLARLHTPLPLLAFTALPEVRSQLALTWGTETFLVPMMDSTDSMIRQVDESLLELGRYKRGDLVVIVAGAPPGTVGSTNLIQVHRIGADDL